MGSSRTINQGRIAVLLLFLVSLAACSQAPLAAQASEVALESTSEATEIIALGTEIAERPIDSVTESACFQLNSPGNGDEIPNLGLVVFEWEAALGASSYQLQMELPNGNAEY